MILNSQYMNKTLGRVLSTDIFDTGAFIYSLEYPCNYLVFEMPQNTYLEDEQKSIYNGFTRLEKYLSRSQFIAAFKSFG